MIVYNEMYCKDISEYWYFAKAWNWQKRLLIPIKILANLFTFCWQTNKRMLVDHMNVVASFYFFFIDKSFCWKKLLICCFSKFFYLTVVFTNFKMYLSKLFGLVFAFWLISKKHKASCIFFYLMSSIQNNFYSSVLC